MKPPPRAPMWWLIAAVVAGGLLRVALGTQLPIGDDEAYYWLWSRHLDWAYPDHPPMIAALIAVSTRLLGDGPFGIRALTILLATATPLIVYRVGRELFGRDAAVRSALLVAILPAFALGTVFAFPDVPLAFFWVLALW
ncbi:MAG: glycosyltransferase family 39 protein, partial [Armatimonadetes bacterium]|nr:glycosyltransferase family 39 protein [Armatimonadota bacterium]